MNVTKSRVLPIGNVGLVKFDSGAWTGWKDDRSNSGEADGTNYKVLHSAGKAIFDTGYMPVAVGPRLVDAAGAAITTDCIFHMVLINDRRSQVI